MASGNLSPRQKMINMMYLVLTALLALNVSSEILDAFQSLEKSLGKSADSFGFKNEQMVKDINQTVADEMSVGDNRNEKYLVVTEEIAKKTINMVATLDQKMMDLNDVVGVDEATGYIEKKDETERNYNYWMGDDDLANGGRGNGEAIKLKAELDQYVEWANGLLEKYDTKQKFSKFEPIALEPKDDPTLDEKAKKGSWEYFTFHNKPVVADLAMMQKYKLDVRQVESELLQLVRETVGGVVFKIDKLEAYSAPVSTVVPAGAFFETRIFPVMSSQSVDPEFSGQGMTVDPSGDFATMRIPASASVIGSGKNSGVQNYSAKIKVPRADGSFEELVYQGSFTVQQPEVVVRSEAVQLLYKGCANIVTVDVPMLGESYNPDFGGSTGGSILPSRSNKKKITIVPSARKFDLNVASNTNGQKIKVGNVKYNVIKPPKPRIAAYVNGKEYDGRTPLKRGQRVTIKVIPDSEFARTLPGDAKYKVGTVKMMLQTSMIGGAKTIASKSGNVMSGITFTLNQAELKNARGAKIYFEVDEVYRVNFQGKSEREALSLIDKMIVGTVN